MQIRTALVDGSAVVSFAFDQTAAAFPQGYDNDALGIDAPEDFSGLLQGVTAFDPASIKFTSGAVSDTSLRPLEDYEVVHGTLGDDRIDTLRTMPMPTCLPVTAPIP